MVTTSQDFRIATRIAVSKETLNALKSRKRGAESYDALLRRMLVSGVERPLSQMTNEEQDFVHYLS